jgi:hypothetical protein
MDEGHRWFYYPITADETWLTVVITTIITTTTIVVISHKTLDFRVKPQRQTPIGCRCCCCCCCRPPTRGPDWQRLAEPRLLARQKHC